MSTWREAVLLVSSSSSVAGCTDPNLAVRPPPPPPPPPLPPSPPPPPPPPPWRGRGIRSRKLHFFFLLKVSGLVCKLVDGYVYYYQVTMNDRYVYHD